MITPQQAREALQLRQAARAGSFQSFCRATIPNYIVSDFHIRLCEVVDRIVAGEIDRAIIEIPPRMGKSKHVSETMPSYFLGKNNGGHVLMTSHSDPMSRRFGRKNLDMVRSKEYQQIFPGMSLSPLAESAIEFETNVGGRFIATGIHGNYMGTGGDLIGIDDPFKSQEDAESQATRDSVWEAFLDIETRAEPGARLFVLHQRWHEDDLIGRIVKDRIESGKEKWFRLKQPMIINECPNWELVEKGGGTPEDVAAYQREIALWPERWSLEACRKIRRRTVRRKWISMYQQEPSSREGNVYRRTWFNRFNIGEQPKNLEYYIISDFAVSKDDGDWTEFYVVGVDEFKNVWFMAAWFAQESAKVWLKAWIELMREWRPLLCFGEAGQIRRALEEFLADQMAENNVYVPIEWLSSSTDKHARSRASIGMASMGKFYIPRTSWGERLIDQLCAFPTSAMDHSFDAVSQIGRAIETGITGAAPEPKEEVKEKIDRWIMLRERMNRGSGNWKVA